MNEMGTTILDQARQDTHSSARCTLRAIVLTDPQRYSLMLVRGGRYLVATLMRISCYDQCPDYQRPTSKRSFLYLALVRLAGSLQSRLTLITT